MSANVEELFNDKIKQTKLKDHF